MAGTSSTDAKTGKVVKYVGTSDVREISKSAWANAGVEDQEKTVWNRDNSFSIAIGELKEAALQVLSKDSGFKVTEA